MKKKRLDELELELSFNVHATEDEKKLINVLKGNFNIEESHFSKTVFEGYHGNPISKYIIIVKSPVAGHVFNVIFKKLESLDRIDLLKNINQNIDSTKAFYLRLDKSSLFSDRFRLNKSNVFHFKFKPKLRYLKDANTFYIELISESVS